jgi:hypothetical protein
MRFSSLVSIFVVVTAGVAMGGCAADNEPTDAELVPSTALVQPSDPVAAIDRTNDARQTGKVSDLLPQGPSDSARARQGDTWSAIELRRLPATAYGDRPSDSLIH